jgi:hypothetical protein
MGAFLKILKFSNRPLHQSFSRAFNFSSMLICFVDNFGNGFNKLVSRLPAVPKFPGIQDQRRQQQQQQQHQNIGLQKSPTDVNAVTNITLCYFTGRDIETSHLQHNQQWAFNNQNTNGLFTYINHMTLGTNILLGIKISLNNFRAAMFRVGTAWAMEFPAILSLVHILALFFAPKIKQMCSLNRSAGLEIL